MKRLSLDVTQVSEVMAWGKWLLDRKLWNDDDYVTKF